MKVLMSDLAREILNNRESSRQLSAAISESARTGKSVAIIHKGKTIHVNASPFKDDHK